MRYHFILSLAALLITLPQISLGQGWNVEMLASFEGYWYYMSNSDVVVSGNYAYIAGGNDLRIFDITDPVFTPEIGLCITPGMAKDVALQGDFAYIADGAQGLRVIDISDPVSPVEIGYLDTPGTAYGICVSGNLAFIADYGSGLRIIDISNPSSPVEIGFYCTASSYCKDVTAAGNYAYVIDDYLGLRIIDISNPASPWQVGFFTSQISEIVIVDSLAYLAISTGGLTILNVSNPAQYFLVNNYSLAGGIYTIAIAGDYAYVCGVCGFKVLNISNPVSPVIIGSIPYYLNWSFNIHRLAIQGNLIYALFFGLKTISVSDPANPIVLGGYSSGHAYDSIVLGNYAVITSDFGIKVLDITDITCPEAVAECALPYEILSMELFGNYLCAVGTDGLWMIDISNPENPVLCGSFNTAYTEDFHDIAIADNFSYTVACNGGSFNGLYIFNIANPANPFICGTLILSGDNLGIAVSGNYAYIAAGWDGLKIIDISNHSSCVVVGNYNTTGWASRVSIDGNYAYVASGELQIINVTDPTEPFLAGSFNTSGSVNNVTISGDYAFIADDIAGLKVVNISNPACPYETGYYNTPGLAKGVTVCGNYAYLSDYNYFEILNCSNALSSYISLSLLPQNPPVIIPSSGGNFRFSISLQNNGAFPITQTIWTYVVLPNNTLKNPLLLRNNYELAAGDTISQLLNQSVAALAPAGEYTYYACFGAYTGEIFASDSFTFTKLPGDNVNSPYRTWECSEWTEPEVTPHLLHPSSFILSASPNPFNPITTLTYSLPEAAEVSLVVFDVCGREIARLVEEFQPAGNYEVKFKGENLPNGMYFARLLASRQSKTVKLLILK